MRRKALNFSSWASIVLMKSSCLRINSSTWGIDSPKLGSFRVGCRDCNQFSKWSASRLNTYKTQKIDLTNMINLTKLEEMPRIPPGAQPSSIASYRPECPDFGRKWFFFGTTYHVKYFFEVLKPKSCPRFHSTRSDPVKISQAVKTARKKEFLQHVSSPKFLTYCRWSTLS